MRILITVAPLMYREAIALAIHRNYPDAEVMIASRGDLDNRVEGFEPHLLIRNDTDGADLELLTDALCWVEVLYSNGLDARVSLDGEVRHVEDIGLDDMLALVEQTRRLIAEEPVG